MSAARAKTIAAAFLYANNLARGIHGIGLVLAFLSTGIILYWSGHPSFYYLTWLAILVFHIFLIALIYIAFVCTSSLSSKLSNDATFHHRRKQWEFAFIALVLIWTSIAFKVPLRLAFLTIKPALEKSVSSPTSLTNGIPTYITGPFHRISSAATNARLERNRHDSVNAGRILFILGDDSESAFIYSPNGIKALVYNSGASGHLIGPWYWMKED
jgi:hypothetical protein